MRPSNGVGSERVEVAELVAAARGIVETNLYMTLATADAEGAPWASPV